VVVIVVIIVIAAGPILRTAATSPAPLTAAHETKLAAVMLRTNTACPVGVLEAVPGIAREVISIAWVVSSTGQGIGAPGLSRAPGLGGAPLVSDLSAKSAHETRCGVGSLTKHARLGTG